MKRAVALRGGMLDFGLKGRKLKAYKSKPYVLANTTCGGFFSTRMKISIKSYYVNILTCKGRKHTILENEK